MVFEALQSEPVKNSKNPGIQPSHYSWLMKCNSSPEKAKIKLIRLLNVRKPKIDWAWVLNLTSFYLIAFTHVYFDKSVFELQVSWWRFNQVSQNLIFEIHAKNLQFLKLALFSSWTMINSDQRHVSSHLVVQSYHKLDVFATLLHHFIVACFCNKVYVTFSRYRCHHQCQFVTWSVSVVRKFWWFKEFENWNFGFGTARTGHICV